MEKLAVTSHVSRDLLQSAALFKNEQMVVWEYVSNSIQYVDPGVSPTVRVRLNQRGKQIVISDNGRGMRFADLANFFTMHGENLDRRAGRAGRGMFGTGKSAAFGIANSLEVTTVRDGRRTRVTLNRAAIEGMTDDSDVPVEIHEREVATDETNGTVVRISGVQLRKMEQKRVIAFIERHLAHSPRDATVWVHNHECTYTPPLAIRNETFVPTGSVLAALGDVTLRLSVAARPLREEERGVSIYSNGVWHETTLGASEGREMSNFIFGEIDVPALEEDESPVRPFDMSRSMRLNANNELVRVLLGFVSANVESLRKELVKEERARKRSEENQRLAEQANEIARVINDDFSEYSRRLRAARAKAGGATDAGRSAESDPSGGDELVFGSEEHAREIADTGDVGRDGEGTPTNGDPRTLSPQVERADETNPIHGQPAEPKPGRKRRPRGGFSIDFRRMGADEARAQYNREAREIVVNLDHPQFVAALTGREIEDPTFRRLAYEVSFTEYALALATELAARGEYLDLTDPIFDVRDTVNRVARRAAALYESN